MARPDTTPATAMYYEQRRTKDTEHSEESKRRRMIRWLKKTVGMRSEPAPPPEPIRIPVYGDLSATSEHRASGSRSHLSSHGSTGPRKYSQDSTGSARSAGSGSRGYHRQPSGGPPSRHTQQHLYHQQQPPYSGSGGGYSKPHSSHQQQHHQRHQHQHHAQQYQQSHRHAYGTAPRHPPHHPQYDQRGPAPLSHDDRCYSQSSQSTATTVSTLGSTGGRQDSHPLPPPPSSPVSIFEFHHQLPLTQKPERRRTPSAAPRVLIIGGGVGGLCLAQGLKKYGIPFTVFERDPAPNYRTQGYRLRINSAGYEALKANLTRDNFEVFLRSTGHFLPGFMYVDAHSGGAAPANVQFAHKSSITRHVFSTDRAMLRSLLLTDLFEEEEIQYGMAFQRYEILPDGRVSVMFENGRVATGSVLVGADGTTSRVRRQYIPHHVTLLDTDSGAIYGKTPLTPEMEAYFATSSTTMVTSQDPPMSLVIEPRCATKLDLEDYVEATGGLSNAANSELPDLHRYLCWVLLARADVFHVREDMTVQDLYAMSPHEVAELSTQITSSWCPRLRTLFEHQAPEWCSFLRISTMSPDLRVWQPSVVTLLGDAVHTMVPAGIGCNTALDDARVLVELFRKHGVNIDAIARYERVVRESGRAGITTSIDAGKRMYNLPDADDMRKVVY